MKKTENNLKILLSMYEMTQTELHRKTGISQSNISKIINGKTDVKLSSIIKICNALDITVVDFFNPLFPITRWAEWANR